MSQSALHSKPLGTSHSLTGPGSKITQQKTSFQLKIPSNVSQGRNIAPIIKGGNGQRGNAAGSQKKKVRVLFICWLNLGCHNQQVYPPWKCWRFELCVHRERRGEERKGKRAWHGIGRMKETRTTLWEGKWTLWTVCNVGNFLAPDLSKNL